MTRRFAALAVLALAPLSAVSQTRQFVVVKQSAKGDLSFEPYEVVEINARDEVRVPPKSQAAVDPNSYNRAPKIGLAEAGALRRTKDGVLAQLKGSPPARSLVLPDQLRFKEALRAEEAWKQVAFTVRKTKKDKGETLGLHQVFAILPCADPATAAAEFVLQPAHFDDAGEHGAALIGAAASFRKAPAFRPVLLYLSRQLEEGFGRFEDGGPWDAFLTVARYAEISQKAFPDDARLMRLAKDVFEKRAWIETSRRALQSLINNHNWDSFIRSCADFEKYQGSFPDMIQARRKAFEESVRFHVQLGRNLLQQKKYVEGLAELRLAQARDPDNAGLKDIVERARLEASAVLARERAALRKPLAEGSPEAIQFNRQLEFAGMAIADNRMKEAEQRLAAAEEIDRDSPRILLVRARYYEGTNQLAKAAETLDAYDAAVVAQPERALGEQLRIKVLYALETQRREYGARLRALMKAGRYSEGHELALKALDVDPHDPDLLLMGGFFSAILRKNDRAVPLLQKYLEVSNSLRGDPRERDSARRVSSMLGARRPAGGEGAPNWMSGRRLAKEIFYCPESLAFQPRIEGIKAGRTDIVFQWTADRKLASVQTRFGEPRGKAEFLKAAGAARLLFRGEGAPAAETGGEPGNFFFEYFPGSAQLARIAYGAPGPAPGAAWKPVAARLGSGEVIFEEPPADPKAVPRWKYLVLPGNPMVNSDVLAFLGNPGGVIFSGNSFFSPFVWDGIHLFKPAYDRAGRVVSAREIGLGNLVRFEWDGERLTGVAAYAIDEKGGETPVYRRTLSYQGGLLAAETAVMGNKTYKLEYKYQGDRLLPATFEDPAAQDGRDREIRFAP